MQHKCYDCCMYLKWWIRLDSDQRSSGYRPDALTIWATYPYLAGTLGFEPRNRWFKATCLNLLATSQYVVLPKRFELLRTRHLLLRQACLPVSSQEHIWHGWQESNPHNDDLEGRCLSIRLQPYFNMVGWTGFEPANVSLKGIWVKTASPPPEIGFEIVKEL